MLVGTLNSNFEIMPLDGAHSPVKKINNPIYEKVKNVTKIKVDLKYFSN